MIALLNPRSAHYGFRVPNTILTLGAFLEGKHDYFLVDENIEADVLNMLTELVRRKGIKYLGITVMPGLQLQRAVFLSKEMKRRFPELVIMWGGYFPTLHPGTVLKSGYVDYVFRGHAELSLPAFIGCLEIEQGSEKLNEIKGLSFCENGNIIHNRSSEAIDPDLIPRLPYYKLQMDKYLRIATTFLGPRTIGYHSSVGCPFLCGFCAVAGVYKGIWKGRNAELIYGDLSFLKKEYNIGAVEFHDNNFFVSEKRTYDFSERVRKLGIAWWGEARPDTVMKFSDETWKSMSSSGCRMIFYGAESGSKNVLKLMDKGGTQTPETVIELAERSKKFGIIPELSFVLGNPTDNVDGDIDNDIRFIKKIKKINPQAEIIIYVYSPVNFEDSEMSLAAKMRGFDYPKTLDEWVSPRWQNFDLRKNPLTPWLNGRHVRKIKDFERTLNAYYPTHSDLKLNGWRRSLLKLLGSWRYITGIHIFPYEIAAAMKLMRYRRPEIEGFAYEE